MEQEELVYTAEGEEIPQGTCLMDVPDSPCGKPKEEGEKEEEEESHSDDVSTVSHAGSLEGRPRH